MEFKLELVEQVVPGTREEYLGVAMTTDVFFTVTIPYPQGQQDSLSEEHSTCVNPVLQVDISPGPAEAGCPVKVEIVSGEKSDNCSPLQVVDLEEADADTSLKNDTKEENPEKEENRGGKSKSKRKREFCDECGKMVLSLNSHKKATHDKDLSTWLQCSHCQMKFRDGRRFWNHYAKFHENLELPPVLLPYSTNSSKIPISFTVTPEGFQCEECKESFPSDANFQRHHYYTHGDGINPDNHLKCDQCSKTFKQKATLDDHIRRVHQGKGFFCDLCPSRGDLQSAGKLWRHKIHKHGLIDLQPPPGLTIMECEFCGEKMCRGLDSHVKKNHPDKLPEYRTRVRLPEITVKMVQGADVVKIPVLNSDGDIVRCTVQCPECFKEVIPSSLKKHLRNVHGIGKVKCIPCPHCGAKFKEKYHMKHHVRDVHDPVQEMLEAKEFFKKTQPSRRGPRVFKCSFCSAQFRNKFQARAHLAGEHSEEYKNVESWEIPEIIFSCKECSEKFKDDNELRSHVDSLHPDTCWRCPKCLQVMLSPEEFATHFKTAHLRETGSQQKLMKGTKGVKRAGRSIRSKVRIDKVIETLEEAAVELLEVCKVEENDKSQTKNGRPKKRRRKPKQEKTKELKIVRVEGSVNIKSMVPPKRRKIYLNNVKEEKKDEEIPPIIVTRKSSRIPKPKRFSSDFITDLLKIDEHEEEFSGRCSYKRKLADVKQLSIFIVPLTDAQIEKYTKPVDVVIKEEPEENFLS